MFSASYIPIIFFGMGHNGILQSLILKSSAVKEMPLIIVTKFYHDIFKTMLKEFLDKNGVEFSENMFQQNFSANAFIYFRHEFSQQLSVTNAVLKVPNKKKLTTADITKQQLEDEFGFHLELNSIK